MRILLLTQYFAPEPVDKWQDLAVGLRDRGHEVEVLTSFPCYPEGKIYSGYQQSLYQEDVIAANKVIRVPQFPDHSSSALRRMFYYCSFAISAALVGLFRIRKPEVIVVYQSALPIGFAAWFLSRVMRVPYVLDVVDLWPESVSASGMLKNRFAIWLIRKAIVFVYSGAKQINVITEGYRESLLQLGVPDEKINVIHCWPAQGLFDPVEVDDEDARTEGFEGRFTIFYAGAIGPCQDLNTVVEAACQLKDLPEVQFVLAGDGVERESLIQRVEELRITNVKFVGRKSPSEVQKLYALADLLLVHLKPSLMSKLSIPSKTFAYMASGRPLLMAVEGESSRLVEKHQCGVTATPSNPGSLAKSIRRFLQYPASVRSEMGWSAREAYLKSYSSEVQVDKVAHTLFSASGQMAA